ncbi:MAG: E3 ubiquitin-protein ligase TRIM41-like isoform X2 [Hyperionvirus sp.]|uniref:E3 ubiquitin-protein ligase TRIM41-like isoform X2 n=1 Tax=Hyperionvirus sp. TaxID=2487770 RepID=A0A3G5ADA6_9VIRU|nr:MAG: E3 ubiquitin-protein ligase TRIM41-like isoform X2 [Hyperionvirus sp.]
MFNCFDIDCFKGSVFLEDLKCPICRDVMVNPLMINCKNRCSFGEQCFKKHVESNGSKCPSCNLNFEGNGVKNYKLGNIIDKMELVCKHKLCGWEGGWSRYGKHLEVCLYESVNCGCGVSYIRLEKSAHDSVCPLFELACCKCKNSICRKNYVLHEGECPELDTECSHCGMKLKFKDLGAHIKSECQEVVTDCKFVPYGCKVINKKRKHIDEHLKEKLDDHFEFIDKRMKMTVVGRQLDHFESIFRAKDGDAMKIDDMIIKISVDKDGLWLRCAEPVGQHIIFVAKNLEINNKDKSLIKAENLKLSVKNGRGWALKINEEDLIHIYFVNIRIYPIPDI